MRNHDDPSKYRWGQPGDQYHPEDATIARKRQLKLRQALLGFETKDPKKSRGWTEYGVPIEERDAFRVGHSAGRLFAFRERARDASGADALPPSPRRAKVPKAAVESLDLLPLITRLKAFVSALEEVAVSDPVTRKTRFDEILVRFQYKA